MLVNYVASRIPLHSISGIMLAKFSYIHGIMSWELHYISGILLHGMEFHYGTLAEVHYVTQGI